MKFGNALLALLMAASALSCNPKAEEGTKHYAPLKNPTKVTLEQVEFSAVVNVTWQDNCDNESGYAIYVKPANGEEQQLASLPVDACEYSIKEGLVQGKSYSIGVRALSDGPMLSSQIIYKEIALFDYTLLPVPTLAADVEYTPTSAMLNYTLGKSEKYNQSAWGLCWSADHTPTLADSFAHGPKNSSVRLYQAIPCTGVEFGKTYKVRAYSVTEKGTTYSNEVVEIKLENETPAITFNWTKVEDTSLPQDIVLYKTTDKLNGRPFNAWYAIADVTKGNVEFRMEFSKEAFTLEDFYKKDVENGVENYIMTNAGYFNMKTGETGDFHVCEGVISPSVPRPTLRGTFGVDKDQKPAAVWASRDADKNTFFYDSPMMNIKGKTAYEEPYGDYPTTSVAWTPYYAMSAGPLLVKNGKVVTDVTKQDGAFVRNYESIAADIFTDTAATPDRTAVGYTEDGKIILFVCDGRITASKGASILEMGQIMKGLGCVGAVNFDGGGSTAMTLYGKRVNSFLSNTSGATENRRVGSVMGFYKKK